MPCSAFMATCERSRMSGPDGARTYWEEQRIVWAVFRDLCLTSTVSGLDICVMPMTQLRPVPNDQSLATAGAGLPKP